jgi:hypothetical protein
MTEAEARDLLMREGFQEEGEARRKWRRAALSATQLSAFTLLTPIFGLLAGVLLMADPLTLRLVTALVGVSVGIALVHRGRPAAQVRPPGVGTNG